jgi:FHS family glucose/mannose:H+ symporter-like MFS transporter
MPLWRIKLPLFLNYFLFAMLLNSVGTVILQVQRNFGVSAPAASVRFGYRRAMLAALAVIALVLAAMPSMPGFFATKLLFVATGASFGVMKISVFATIGLITRNEKDHASFMSFIESFFMVGILSSYFLFSAFVGDTAGGATTWFQVYYVLAGIAALAFVLLFFTPLDESDVHRPGDARTSPGADFLAMLQLAWSPLVLVFVASVFIYVMIEQGIMSWLPTFNNQILRLPAALSIEMASILAASTALGRFLAGWILRRVHWFAVVAVCLAAAAALVLAAMPLAARTAPGAAITGWGDAPLASFIFPLIGLFLAPVYPVINSAILSALPPARHGAMSGLIVIFSALGGTTGSLVTGFVFANWGGQRAFYLSLVPIIALLVALFAFARLLRARPRVIDVVAVPAPH